MSFLLSDIENPLKSFNMGHTTVYGHTNSTAMQVLTFLPEWPEASACEERAGLGTEAITSRRQAKTW